jgi:hypothetical protein
MNELFEIPETKSPRLIWMERHGITMTQNLHMTMNYGYWMFYQGMDCIAVKRDYDDAVLAGATILGLKLWNEEGAQ